MCMGRVWLWFKNNILPNKLGLLTRWGLSLVCVVAIFGGTPAFAAKPQASRVFLLTSTYGVLVGTLTGLASLAFYEEPGLHRRNIALGASLGLYTGILLGGYVYLLAPDPNAPRSRPVEEDDEEANWEGLNPSGLKLGYLPSTRQWALGYSLSF